MRMFVFILCFGLLTGHAYAQESYDQLRLENDRQRDELTRQQEEQENLAKKNKQQEEELQRQNESLQHQIDELKAQQDEQSRKSEAQEIRREHDDEQRAEKQKADFNDLLQEKLDEQQDIEFSRNAAKEGLIKLDEDSFTRAYGNLSRQGFTPDQVQRLLIKERAFMYRAAKSAAAGDAKAQVQLGNAYRDGNCVKKDLPKAIEWYSRAAAQGNGEAKTLLKQLQVQ